MLEFLAMGGYAGYVWSAVGITAVVMAANVVAARVSH
ncbi:MAG: heme exporter protein CcmD, partial [Pseudomonadota bacterium]